MPAGRARGAAVTAMIDGKLYVAGGLTSTVVDLVDVYDPATERGLRLQRFRRRATTDAVVQSTAR